MPWKRETSRGNSAEFLQNPFIERIPVPTNETENEKSLRIEALQDALAISKKIDEGLLASKKLLDRRKKAVKIMLLGQAESGKSAVLKNFQMAFTPSQLNKERVMWRQIIHLNLISHIKILLLTVQDELDSTSSSPADRTLKRLLLSLSPLLSVNTDLTPMPERLDTTQGRDGQGAPLSSDMPESPMLANFAAQSQATLESLDSPDTSIENQPPSNSKAVSFKVRALSGWKFHLASLTDRTSSEAHDDTLRSTSSSTRAAFRAAKHDPRPMLEASRDDIITFWNDPDVRQIMHQRNIRLEGMSGFFLDDVSRIVDSKYVPTNCDIVRARVSTLGVEEHHLIVEHGPNKGTEFYISDVAGCRSARASWIPFFDDVQAILFLAPLVFDQMLEEDPRINRLEDSLASWKEICSNALLADCILIIFFNKTDLLKATLDAGVMVRNYVPSFGDMPNDFPHVTKYFKDRFKIYHKRYSPKPRSFLSYETSAIDTDATVLLVTAVQEGLLRRHLQTSTII